MRINSNIYASVVGHNLSRKGAKISDSIDRLSSGYRINRGADDAAGLTISEKLRNQIKGLNRAITNSQDAVSVLQSADGALNEVSSNINRLRELAIQAQDDALTSTDRMEIQKEVDQLVDEIDRVSSTTEFNNIKLLDGTAEANVSVNGQGLSIHQREGTGELGGDYKVRVSRENDGVSQEVSSSIFRDINTGYIADVSTKIEDLSQFESQEFYNLQEIMQIRGNGNSADILVSEKHSIEDLVNSLKKLITLDEEHGGLGIKGTDVSYDIISGKIEIVSGISGSDGEISLIGSETLQNALGFQETVESKEQSYRVYASSQNNMEVDGFDIAIDMQVEQKQSAAIESTLSPVNIITTGDSDISFKLAQTNGKHYLQVSLRKNTSYSLVSIVDIVNSNVATGVDKVLGTSFYDAAVYSEGYKASNIVASIEDGRLKLDTEDGSGFDFFDVSNSAVDILGIPPTQETLADLNKLSMDDFTLTTAAYAGSLNWDNNVVADLGTNYQVADWTQLEQFYADGGNLSLLFDNLGLTAWTSSAWLTWNDDSDSMPGRYYYAARTDHVLPGGFLAHDNINANEIALGSWMNPNRRILAIDENLDVSGSYDAFKFKQSDDIGYTFDTTTAFELTDKHNNSTGKIVFGVDGRTGAATATNNNITYSNASIAAVLDATNIGSTDVMYQFDKGGKLQFKSRSEGSGSFIRLNTLDPRFGVGEPANFDAVISDSTLNSTFGFESKFSRGWGDDEFDIHIADSRLDFMIGANKSQLIKFGISDFSSESLGLRGLDLTNESKATEALGSLDRGALMVVSKRSQLGSIQNRLEHTMTNLGNTSVNLSSSESLIRDVDFAVETVELTKNQILQESCIAMLSQTRGLSQQVLELVLS